MINLANEAQVQRPIVMRDLIIWLDAIDCNLAVFCCAKGLGPRLLSTWTGVKTIQLLIVDNILTYRPCSVYMHKKSFCNLSFSLSLRMSWHSIDVSTSLLHNMHCGDISIDCNWIQDISVVEWITDSLLCVTCRCYTSSWCLQPINLNWWYKKT